MISYIKEEIGNLEFYIRVLNDLNELVSEFNQIPNHKIKFRNINFKDDRIFYVFLDKDIDPTVLKSLNNILDKQTSTYRSSDPTWKVYQFTQNDSKTYKFHLCFRSCKGHSYEQEPRLITTKKISDFCKLTYALQEYLKEYKSGLFKKHIKESK